MTENKTKPTAADVDAFVDAIPDESRREDSRTILRMMKRITGEEPKLWGTSIVGFGTYHYAYESGREGDWFLVGFSPRKGDLTLYITPGFEKYAPLMEKLGRFKTGKSCLYIRSLEDIDRAVLVELIKRSVRDMVRARVLAKQKKRALREGGSSSGVPERPHRSDRREQFHGPKQGQGRRELGA